MEVGFIATPILQYPPPNLLLLIQERQESRCSLILDSCTFAWHTGQLTISAEKEEEEGEEEVTLCGPAEEWGKVVEVDEEDVVVTVLCCTAGDFVFIDSLDAAESLANVFWKKSKMLAELLRSSRGLFLWPPPAAPNVPSLLESVKYLECVGWAGLLLVGTTGGYSEWLDSLGLDVLGEEELCCLGKKEEAEVALTVRFGDVSEPLLVSVFEMENWLTDFLRSVLPKRSWMDLCLILSVPWPLLLLWGLGIFTGEPLMLTKTRVLLTDLFIGGFCPAEVVGLMEGKAVEIPLVGLFKLERTGELRGLAGDEGVKSFLGEEMGLEEDVFTGTLTGTRGLWEGEEEVEDWDFPPSRKPLPLNGIMFLISCDPDPEGKYKFESDNKFSMQFRAK